MSAEPALAALHRRLAAAGAEIGRLKARIAALEGAASEGFGGAGQRERERLLADLASERSRRRAVEQALADERERRSEVESEIELLRVPWSAAAERELAVWRRRAEALEGELETVRRHDAEFEQAIRLAVGEAWAWLAEIRERLGAALARVEAERGIAGGAGGRGGGGAAGGGPPGREEPVRVERLDQALSRLREGAIDLSGKDKGSGAAETRNLNAPRNLAAAPRAVLSSTSAGRVRRRFGRRAS